MRGKSESSVQIVLWGLAINILLVVGKALAGYFGNSYALLADAVESCGDVFASGLVLFAIQYASRPADENHPYGHGRAEPLITFLVVAFLVVSATIIVYESVRNIYTPHELPAAWTLIVLGGIIAIKEIFYRIMVYRAKQANSTSMKADAVHHRADAITSFTAFIGISIALYLGKGYESADDWAALVASLIIYYNSYLIFRPALGEIMDEHVHDELVLEIRTIAATVQGVRDTEKCHIRKSGMKYYVDLHARVDPAISVKEGHDIAHLLKDTLQKELPQIANVLVHIEPSKS